MLASILQAFSDPIVIRLLLALVLGALVGLEREFTRHPAGLRTHILVCMGSAVFTILSVHSLLGAADVGNLVLEAPEGVDLRVVRDPARIAAQVVTGIGFVGGGVVLRHGATIRGLTTAASLWMVASIGMLAGSGYTSMAVISTVMTLVVLLGFRRVGWLISRKNQKSYNRLKLTINLNAEAVLPVQTFIDDRFRGQVVEIKTQHLELTTTEEGAQCPEELVMAFVVDMTNQDVLVNQLIRDLDNISGVRETFCRLYFSNLGQHDD